MSQRSLLNPQGRTSELRTWERLLWRLNQLLGTGKSQFDHRLRKFLQRRFVGGLLAETCIESTPRQTGIAQRCSDLLQASRLAAEDATCKSLRAESRELWIENAV